MCMACGPTKPMLRRPGWFTIAVAGVVCLVSHIWHHGMTVKHDHEAAAKVSSQRWRTASTTDTQVVTPARPCSKAPSHVSTHCTVLLPHTQGSAASSQAACSRPAAPVQKALGDYIEAPPEDCDPMKAPHEMVLKSTQRPVVRTPGISLFYVRPLCWLVCSPHSAPCAACTSHDASWQTQRLQPAVESHAQPADAALFAPWLLTIS